jgi:hypothetical protein
VILRKVDERFSEVVRDWEGQTVVLIGGGPSLTLEDIGRVFEAYERGRVCVIAINSAYLLAPWADVCLFADSHWWKWHTDGIAVPALGLSAHDVRDRFASFSGQKCTIENSGGNITDPAVHVLRNKNGRASGFGISHDPRALVDGRNSGALGLNLSVLAGATKNLLLGFDGKPDGDKSHMLGAHPRPTPEAAYPLYVQAMREIKKAIKAAKLDVSVVNCSPGSAIDAWPRMSLEDALTEYAC